MFELTPPPDGTFFADLADEVADQEQEVFHFRSVEHLPEERVFE